MFSVEIWLNSFSEDNPFVTWSSTLDAMSNFGFESFVLDPVEDPNTDIFKEETSRR